MSKKHKQTLVINEDKPSCSKTYSCLTTSSGDGEELEDGEIFDDDDDIPVPAPVQTAAPPSPPSIFNADDKKKLSKVRKIVPQQRRATKRPRDEERPFRSSKQRRRSEESDKSRDKPFLSEDEDIREFSPLRLGPAWDRGHHRPAFDDMDDNDDDELGRRGRSFDNRRRGRNGRGGMVGKRGMGRRENSQICKFFLQGKCQKGSECPFSHSQKKLEVCKFYMMDCCMKKDRCPFLHSEYPCKYYQLGMKCFAGKKCKFTHGKISAQLRANLLRDSKERLGSPPPRDESGGSQRERVRDRDRDREHRDRGHRDKESDRSKDRDRERERDRKADKDRFTLHFKVDPRTVSDEEESRTPMLMHDSPFQATTSDRGSRSPEVDKKDPSPNVETPALPDPKDNGFSGDEYPNFIPADLPKHQRELYKRIQQHHNPEASKAKTEVEEVEKETEDYKDEDWYSSEEEENTKKIEPITALLNKLKQQPAVEPVPREPSPPKQNTVPPQIIVPPILPDFDISAVSKLLSTVRETIQQKQQILNSGETLVQTGVPLPSNTSKPPSVPLVPTVIPPVLNPLPPLASLVAEPTPSAEKRRMRDPRLRGNSTDDDVDLRMGPREDVDLRQLPFKPAPVHTPAYEIDASVASHPAVVYRVISISPPPPPDYSTIRPKNTNDPRLRKHFPGALLIRQLMIPPVVPLKTTLEPPRDPRQRSMVAKDPRRKSSLLFQSDSDLRQSPQNFNLVNDVDLRMHPPSSHLPFK